MSKPERNERLGEAKEMTAAWEYFSRGNVHRARVEAKRVLAIPGVSDAAKTEATDLLERTAIDRAHLYAAILVAGALISLFMVEELVNGWRYGFEGPAGVGPGPSAAPMA